MDPGVAAILGALVGGVATGVGGYLAVVVTERRRADREQAERLRALRRAILADTRDNLLSLLDVSMARAIGDVVSEEHSGWPEASRRRRVDRGFIGDPELLRDYLQLTNRLLALALRRMDVDAWRDVPPFAPEDALAFGPMRSRVAQTFIEQEERLETGKPLAVLPPEQVGAIEAATPLGELLAAAFEASKDRDH